MTRKNSASFTLLDIQKLIAESEERVIEHVNKRFDALASKIDSLESTVRAVKAVQVQQGKDMDHIKELILNQQHQMEAFEEKDRRCNLVVSNLPETDVSFENDTLSDDEEKVKALLNTILPTDQELRSEDVIETARIGRAGRSPRILKLRLSSVDCRNRILRSARHLNSTSIRDTFGRIYVNKDMSYLRRLEEKRLRLRYKELKAIHPDETRLKNGKLFLGLSVKDCARLS